jgi:hypothetical protein
MTDNRMTLHQLIGSSWQVTAGPTSDFAHHHMQMFDDITPDYIRGLADEADRLISHRRRSNF